MSAPGNGSISQRLHAELREMIAATEPGERLPSEPNLARKLGVSRATLREAMRAFETQGLIRRRQGAGTFVQPPSHVIEGGLEVLESIETQAQRIGLKVHMGDLRVVSQPASQAQAGRFQIYANDPVMQLSRVIYTDDRPVAYLIDTVPESVLSPDELGDDFSGSVLDLFIERGDPHLLSSRCEISAITATPEIARLLGIQRGDGLLCFEAYLYDGGGELIDHSLSYFLPGIFRFHVVRKVGT
ncbi:MAG: GntR family transcriptional regulator [Anaerolineales bacterium]